MKNQSDLSHTVNIVDRASTWSEGKPIACTHSRTIIEISNQAFAETDEAELRRLWRQYSNNSLIATSILSNRNTPLDIVQEGLAHEYSRARLAAVRHHKTSSLAISAVAVKEKDPKVVAACISKLHYHFVSVFRSVYLAWQENDTVMLAFAESDGCPEWILRELIRHDYQVISDAAVRSLCLLWEAKENK
jgi:hypothetical protein